MSDYLYNLVARSFGLVETAQPLVTSLFEPPRDFKPVDALQDAAPKAVTTHAFDREESVRPASSAPLQPDAPAQTTQTTAINTSPSTNDASLLPKTERAAAQSVSESHARLNVIEPAQEKERAPGRAASHVESQSGRTPSVIAQPSLQREPQSALREPQTQPASIERGASPIKSTEHTPPPAQTIRTHERVIIEPLPHAVENPLQASAEKPSQAKTETRIAETVRERAQPSEQRPHLVEPPVERKRVERALSNERPPARLKPEPSAEQVTRSLSQPLKVAAFDSPSQKTAESISSVEINNITHERSETVVVQPQISRYVEAQRPEALQPTRAAEPEQIVQVTIGRIEVRAAAQTPARGSAQQKSAQQPSQSLEEYLRQRAQGGGGSR
jgi:hypothetical protein